MRGHRGKCGENVRDIPAQRVLADVDMLAVGVQRHTVAPRLRPDQDVVHVRPVPAAAVPHVELAPRLGGPAVDARRWHVRVVKLQHRRDTRCPQTKRDKVK